MATGIGRSQNRLSTEASPYLRQHADNPVDWYPWGDEAFTRARAEDKPIFLSIGYATCHWCHVMAHESFENDSVAEILNRDFVCIKIDREERPDIDQIYMTAVTQGIGQQGGWPLSVWLTPDLQPFVGGTYFPPEDKWGRRGFKSILRDIADHWKNRRKDIDGNARAITEFLQKSGTASAPGELNEKLVTGCLAEFDRAFDDTHGGFGRAPKFPQPSYGSFLLRLHARTQDRLALEMVESQLQHMAHGGIYDHLGGGFARYSTDERWLVPHFEKMLYDNAQLLKLYAETYRLTRNPEYARVIRETADYVLRDMTDRGGGFFSAEDADSEGVEGKFYAWRRNEIVQLLGERDARIFCLAYGVSDEGNWIDPHHDTHGLNVLHRNLSDGQTAGLEKISENEVKGILARGRAVLFEARSNRGRPGLDDKILTSWNGLMIGAMAYAGATLSEPRYVDAARGAARFVLATFLKEGRLLHRARGDSVGVEGLLEDYAYLVSGFLDLYEATLETPWLEHARNLNTSMIERFHDTNGGGFFLAPPDQTDLLVRSKEVQDGALPAPANSATINLVRLSEITLDDTLKDRARKTLESYGRVLKDSPLAVPNLLIAADWLLGPSRQIVLAGEAQTFQNVLTQTFLSRSVIVHASSGETLSPLVKGKGTVDGKPAAYLCENFTCQRPVTGAASLEGLLAK